MVLSRHRWKLCGLFIHVYMTVLYRNAVSDYVIMVVVYNIHSGSKHLDSVVALVADV